MIAQASCDLGTVIMTQARHAGSARGRDWLLHHLLAIAFDHLGEGVPAVVGVDGDAGGLAYPWTRLDVNDASLLADAVHQQLNEGPAVVLPPWDEQPGPQPGSGIRRSRVLPPEAVLLECRPAGPGSLLAIITPESTLTSERARPVRESLAAYWQPAVVLYATEVVPGIHPSFGLAVTIFRATQKRSPGLLIFRIPDAPDPAVVEEDFRQLLTRRQERGLYGYVIGGELPAGESLQFERHDPAVLARHADLAGYGGVVPLGELFELPSPGVHLAHDRDLLCAVSADGAVRVLGGRDIGRDGMIAQPDDRSQWARAAPGRQLQAGDLIVREIYHPTDRSGLVVADVTADDLPAAADQHVVVLRPREAVGPQHRLFVTLFLRTPLARTLTLGSGGGMHLRRADLRRLDLPMPDQALAAALDHVAEARERLEAWRREADGLLQTAFLDESAGTARRRIVTASRKLRLRVEEASLVDDFGHFVRTRFPYPVALRWRRIQAAVGEDQASYAYREILDAAEILLCYAAQLGLAISREQNITLGATTGLRRRMEAGRGPGLGDWRAILLEISSNRAFRELPANHPLRDLSSLVTNPDADAARRRLNDRRNDEAHQRHVDPIDMPYAVTEAAADLTTLVEQAQFLADWPLIYVDSTRWDTFRGVAAISYRQLMGDHAIVPPQIAERHGNDLEQGSLYIIDSEYRWHVLRPFLVGRDCPVCKNWSTFHADRDDQGSLVIKSLEHGHVGAGDFLAEPLRHVGLL
jgi:hypothetical protein